MIIDAYNDILNFNNMPLVYSKTGPFKTVVWNVRMMDQQMPLLLLKMRAYRIVEFAALGILIPAEQVN